MSVLQMEDVAVQPIAAHPKTARVLIVDDNTVNRLMLSNYVEGLNYAAETVVNGQEALRILETEQFDLVLLDVEMPVMNGYEVLEQLKANPALRDLPVIMISALDELDNIVKCIELGAEDYLPKPFNPVLLRARLNACLEKKRLRDQEADLQRKELAAMEKLTRLKDQFVNTVSHDLRNPINTVLGYSDLLQESLQDSTDPTTELFLNKIRSSSRHMLNLVNDLLDLAKIETGGILELQVFHLGQFLQERYEEFELLAQQKGLNFSYQPPPIDRKLNIDTLRMSQVVNNLLSNALKYTPLDGTVTLTGSIHLNQNGSGGWALIQVSDSGLGIPEEDIPHLFDKFYRVNRTEHRAVEGTGLGLSIVKAIVESHGGEIRVESELGKGSSFIVTLPLESL